LVVSAALAALGRWSGGFLPGWAVLLQVVNLVVSFGITTLLFAMVYRILPRVWVAWEDVWVGAAVTALLFNIGKLAIGLYLGIAGLTSGFGAAGSLVMILAWVYYSSQIFLLGAEFTWVFAHSHGSRAGETPEPGPPVPSRSSTG
jgi:membrane protein